MTFRGLVRDLAGARRVRGSAVPARPVRLSRPVAADRGRHRRFRARVGLNRLRTPALPALLILSAAARPRARLDRAHDEALGYASARSSPPACGAVLNLWRATSFTGLLFRGLRAAQPRCQERRRDLDASAARLERRVASLQVEADSAEQRAEALASRAGAGAPSSRPQAPRSSPPARPRSPPRAPFSLNWPGMAAGGAAPQRLVVAVDRSTRCRPAEARRFLEIAVRSPDPARRSSPPPISPASPKSPRSSPRACSSWSTTSSISARTPPRACCPRRSRRPRRSASPAVRRSPSRSTRPRSATSRREPADRCASAGAETVLQRLSAGPAWRRAARGGGAVAGRPDGAGGRCAAALRWTWRARPPWPAGPAALKAAFDGLDLEGADKPAARAAFEAARRFAPWG